jgi:hypothetical protein
MLAVAVAVDKAVVAVQVVQLLKVVVQALILEMALTELLIQVAVAVELAHRQQQAVEMVVQE